MGKTNYQKKTEYFTSVGGGERFQHSKSDRISPFNRDMYCIP